MKPNKTFNESIYYRHLRMSTIRSIKRRRLFALFKNNNYYDDEKPSIAFTCITIMLTHRSRYRNLQRLKLGRGGGVYV